MEKIVKRFLAVFGGYDYTEEQGSVGNHCVPVKFSADEGRMVEFCRQLLVHTS